MATPIRFQRPSLPSGEAIEGYLRMAREERWFSNFGPCDRLLRARLTRATGRSCVTVANATLGLMVAIAALRRRAAPGAGDVLLPSFAFAASAQAVMWNQLNPVFVDVDPHHWHLDPDALEAALAARRPRVALVVALSSFGVPPPTSVRQRWERVCSAADVPLLVDSAAGYGAHAADGVAIGAQGDAEVVSFHALKPVSAGEGGAVFCRDENIAAEITDLTNFTFDSNHQALRADGLNAKMSEPAAAIALASLDELETALALRAERANELISRLPADYTLQVGHEHGTWQFVATMAPDAETRSDVLAEASRREITVRTYYDPLHRMAAFAGCEHEGGLAVTEQVADRMLSLPMATDLTHAELSAIVDLTHVGTPSRPVETLAHTGRRPPGSALA